MNGIYCLTINLSAVNTVDKDLEHSRPIVFNN